MPPTSAHDVGFLLTFHAWFAAAAAVLLGPFFLNLEAAARLPYSSGTAVCGLILCWHIAFAILSRDHVERRPLYEIWRFVSILSVLMVVPDWFLVDVLGSLIFPNDGAYMIGGSVSIYMAGMWSIPLMWILACFPLNHGAKSELQPTFFELCGAASVALVVFAAAEQLTVPLGLWVKDDKVKFTAGHVALYVLPAEAALGAAALHAHRNTALVPGWTGSIRRLLAAAVVAVFYTGALAISYLLIEA